MEDDSIRREIEENNARKDAEQDDQRGLTGLVDDAISPITEAIDRAGSDDDEQDPADEAIRNDADQRA
jgi:hypothetical protein